MTEDLILAIDQGTTGTTALIIDNELKVVGHSNAPFEQHFPKATWVEHLGHQIWESVRVAVNGVFEKTGVTRERIKAIGITNQRETLCAFDHDGDDKHPFIVWQCKRSMNVCSALKEEYPEDVFQDKTGLVFDPYFTGTKMRWLLEEKPELKESANQGSLRLSTIDAWLVAKLSSGQSFATDVTNASRTGLSTLKNPFAWDDELLVLFGVPKISLPTVLNSADNFGVTKGLDFLPDGIPISGVAGDQQAALFGQACFLPGEAKCTFGTGCFLLMNTGVNPLASQHGLLTTVAYSLAGTVHYALEGSAFIGGAAVQWLRDGLGLIKSAEEIEVLAKASKGTGPLCFVPSLSGLGAPHWRPEATGVIHGITRGTTKADICLATLEGIAMQNADILNAMESEGIKITSIRVDGGAATNNLLMQLQADALQVDVIRPKVIETTALGAAALAGLGTGIFKDLSEIQSVWATDQTFKPSLGDVRLKQWQNKWVDATQKA